MLLQLTGAFERSFKVDWSFDTEDEIIVRRFKIRWCHSSFCPEDAEWVEKYMSANATRSFTLTVTDTVYTMQIIAEAISDEVPIASLAITQGGKT